VAAYWVRRLDEIPLVPTDDPGDFDWYPLQHHLGLSAFGRNAFRGDVGATLVAEHDDRARGRGSRCVGVLLDLERSQLRAGTAR
jgi:hypothetical protein